LKKSVRIIVREDPHPNPYLPFFIVFPFTLTMYKR